jgi:hypothetical protein
LSPALIVSLALILPVRTKLNTTKRNPEKLAELLLLAEIEEARVITILAIFGKNGDLAIPITAISLSFHNLPLIFVLT